MRYDKDHKQQTRGKVLDAAARTIRASGPDRIGVASVMAEAGLTHGGFYAHFSSKDDLVIAAIGHMFEQSAARLRRETEGRGPVEGLAAYVDFYLSARHRDARASGCPIAALASDLPRLTDPARAIFADGLRRLTAALGERISALGRLDADAEARSLVAELVGALSLARIEPDRKQSDAILSASRRLVKERLGLGPRA